MRLKKTAILTEIKICSFEKNLQPAGLKRRRKMIKFNKILMDGLAFFLACAIGFAFGWLIGWLIGV